MVSVIWDSHTNESVISSQLKHCNSACLLLQPTCDSAHAVFIIKDRGLFPFIGDFLFLDFLTLFPLTVSELEPRIFFFHLDEPRGYKSRHIVFLSLPSWILFT